MHRVLMAFAMLVLCASAAFAQDDYNKFEFFGGFSHNRIDTGITDSDPDFSDIIEEREGFNGFNTSITGNVNRHLGFKFDFSGHFKKSSYSVGTSAVDVDSTLFNALGGVQVKDNSKETRFKPFAHALAGIARARSEVTVPPQVCVAIFPSPCPSSFTESETGFAAALGGGLDIRAGRRVDIRAFQFDYNPTRLFDSTQHNFRIGFGIVIH